MNEENVQEFIKCKQQPTYFIEKYGMIKHPVKGKIPFILYPFQHNIVKQFQTNRFVISNKSRQVGMSTITALYALWFGLFHNNKQIVIISIKDKDAMSFLKKIKLAYEDLPAWLKDDKKPNGEPLLNNAHELELITGSLITSVASGGNAGRGEALSLLIVDEAAFIERIEDIWTSAYPTLSRGGSGIIISTPNGISNFFYEKWSSCQPDVPIASRSNFKPVFVHWTDIPEYRGYFDKTGMTFDEIVTKAKEGEWYKDQRPQVSDRKWAQEFEGDFLGSGNTVVDNNVLKESKDYLIEPIKKEGDLWIWKEPVPGRMYIIGADIAGGEGSDYSAAQVLDLLTGEQVAEYKSQIDLMKYANLLVELGNYYNEAYLAPENTGLGLGVVQKIVHEIGYSNLHQEENVKTMRKKKLNYGWTTSGKSRPLLISAIQDYFNSREFEWHSERLWKEAGYFVWKEGSKAEADGKANDDLMMAMAIACYNREVALRNLPVGYMSDMEIAVKVRRSESVLDLPQNNAKYEEIVIKEDNSRPANEEINQMQVGDPDEFAHIDWLRS